MRLFIVKSPPSPIEKGTVANSVKILGVNWLFGVTEPYSLPVFTCDVCA